MRVSALLVILTILCLTLVSGGCGGGLSENAAATLEASTHVASPAVTAPTVTHWSPRGTGGLNTLPVTVTFTVPMHRPSVQNNFTVHPAAAGAFSWAGRKLTFTPTSNWTPGRRYRVTINAAARSADGVRLGTPFTWNFIILAPLDVGKAGETWTGRWHNPTSRRHRHGDGDDDQLQ